MELEHIIRAAAEVAGDDELVVVGSQAILGQFPEAPEQMLTSREADIYPKNRPEQADEIEGSLGDGSYFDSSFGYYAHAVGPETAKAPAGWEGRLVPVRSENTGGATGWCLEAHDLVLSKCAAGRERDWEFAREALRHGLVDPDELQRRSADLPMPSSELERIERMLSGII
ncbi:MAG: DUF6036 family nucleotidyltransferase [Solirubrobacterales bacterium]